MDTKSENDRRQGFISALLIPVISIKGMFTAGFYCGFYTHPSKKCEIPVNGIAH
jgi:hypothetical protein